MKRRRKLLDLMKRIITFQIFFPFIFGINIILTQFLIHLRILSTRNFFHYSLKLQILHLYWGYGYLTDRNVFIVLVKIICRVCIVFGDSQRCDLIKWVENLSNQMYHLLCYVHSIFLKKNILFFTWLLSLSAWMNIQGSDCLCALLNSKDLMFLLI